MVYEIDLRCQPSQEVDFDTNHEPTASDHGNVLYTIKKDPVVGRYMVAARDIMPGEVIFTDQPAVVGMLVFKIPELRRIPTVRST
jgi:hypothetical protein